MKELSIEAKARRYDEAIKYARIYYTNGNEDMKMMIKTCFPVLVEDSEDERVRKDIIWCLKHSGIKESNPINPHVTTTAKDAIAWLEKQESAKCPEHCVMSNCSNCPHYKEQKPTDNLTPQEAMDIAVAKCFKQGEQKPIDGSSAFKNKLLELFQRFRYRCIDKIPTNGEILEYVNDHIQELIDTVKNEPVEVEPKFKVGYWYQCIKDFFGKGVTFDKNTAYYCAKEGCLQNEYGCHIAIVKDLYDNFKLWTIQDAKNGDVLTWDNTTCVVLFKNIKNSRYFISYCLANFISFEIGTAHYIEGCHPATKEQRDLLFQKMKEAGYEWDAEHKQLKKIEHKSAEWSEEDEKRISSILLSIEYCKEQYPNLREYQYDIDWLKSLRPQKQ